MKKIRFYCELFFKILPKFIEFENSDYCIEKITLESSRPRPVSIQN